MVANGARIVVILGPTSTGKSDLALWLAPRISGEIVNADSMQVYRHFDIGSAKPESAARGLVPHHLVDVIDPDVEFNAALFQKVADDAIADITSRKAVPVVVGGTGLYLRVLLHGLFPVQSDRHLRERLRQQYIDRPLETYEELRARDPEYAFAVSHRDMVRVVRGLEISLVSGLTMSEWRKAHGFREVRYGALKIGLRAERQELYGRINERVLRMLDAGWIKEVEGLLHAGWDPKCRPFQSIGYREILLHLKGELDYETMVGRIKMATRHYAKRQLTWFSKEKDVEWYEYPRDCRPILERVRRFLS
jgi:tRNA dimethylallyltransferase